MCLKTSCLLMLLVALSNVVLPITAMAQDSTTDRAEGCTPEDADPIALDELGIRSTASALSSTITMEAIEEQMTKALENDPSLTELVAEEQELQKTMVADQEKQQISLHFGHYWYWPTCPYRVYWLYWKHWYFSSGNSKCWAFYPVYYTSCGNKYCRMSYKPYFWWHHYYRCLPEYRYHIIWAMCYNSESGWHKKPIKVLLRRGCCCKRFWWNRFTTPGVCPAN